MKVRGSNKFLGLYARPPRWLLWCLGAVPFVLAVGLYLFVSHSRLTENPSDKLFPSIGQMADAAYRFAVLEDRREGKRLLLADTTASMTRLGTGLGLALLAGLVLGILNGLYPGARALLMPGLVFLSIIPPLAILPILFIAFGVDELGKVMLIFLGTFPGIARDLTLYVIKLPNEQITKAITLGASPVELIQRVILPQVLPRLFEAARLALGPAWLFLIAAEAIAAESGLGYRVFLVRRYLAMDVIIPYVLWITVIGFVMDVTLRFLSARLFPWYVKEGADDL